MKLTEALFRWKKALPKGNIYHGKYRLVKQVTNLDKAKKRTEYDLEERNMFYLRHPYMTFEQARGHAVSFKHNENFIERKKEEKLNTWKKHKLLGDRFGFLKVSESWE